MTAPHGKAAAPPKTRPAPETRAWPAWVPYLLLAFACLLWSGNWVTGRALRDEFSPVGLTFCRWSLALMLMLPLALPRIRQIWPEVRRHRRSLMFTGAIGAAAFQAMVYAGLQYTTAINALILNSAVPVLVMSVSWLMLRETVTWRRVLGGVISIGGILVVASRGDLAILVRLDFGLGDLIILCALLLWAVYTVSLRRWPVDLRALDLLTVFGVFGYMFLVPAFLFDRFALGHTLPVFTLEIALAVGYVAVFASVVAMVCWNKGVSIVGANTAGFMNPLMPAFGTILAITILGETIEIFHIVGISLILCGVFMSSWMRQSGSAGETGTAR